MLVSVCPTTNSEVRVMTKCPWEAEIEVRVSTKNDYYKYVSVTG